MKKSKTQILKISFDEREVLKLKDQDKNRQFEQTLGSFMDSKLKAEAGERKYTPLSPCWPEIRKCEGKKQGTFLTIYVVNFTNDHCTSIKFRFIAKIYEISHFNQFSNHFSTENS